MIVQSLTSNDDGVRWFNEGAAPSDGDQGTQHSIGDLIGVEGLISLVDLHQTGDGGLQETRAGAGQTHAEGNAAHSGVDTFACVHVCSHGNVELTCN